MPWMILLRYRLLTTQHCGMVRESFDLSDIIYSPHSFHVGSSFIIKVIWGAWNKVAS